MNEALENYQFHEAAQTLYRFVWNEFCDWYLEWIKPVLSGPASDAKKATQATLRQTLEVILRLSHPFLPFITEEIWQHLGKGGGEAFLVVASYPVADKKKIDSKVQAAAATLQQVVGALRNLRAEHQVKPQQKLAVIAAVDNKKEAIVLQENEAVIRALAGVGDFQFLGGKEKPKACATVVAGTTTLFVPFKELFDVSQEKERLTKEIAKTTHDLELFLKKMSDENFVKRAPKEVVDKERVRLKEQEERLGKLKNAYEQLASL